LTNDGVDIIGQYWIKFEKTIEYLNLSTNLLDFIAKVAQIHGHMGLKMVHVFKAHKDKIYSRLGVLYIILTLSFEGVVPTQKNPPIGGFFKF